MQHATGKGQKGVRCPRVIISLTWQSDNLVRLRACHVSIFKIGPRRTISSSWTNLHAVVFQVSRKHLAIINTVIIAPGYDETLIAAAFFILPFS